MDSIGMSCIKYILFFFNLLFSLSGLALVTVGIIIKNSYYSYSRFIDDSFYSPPWILIIVGGAVFVVAFFGCCGAIRESNCMLIMFSLLLFVIVILEALVALSGYYLRSDIDLMLQTKMNASISDYATNAEIRKSWDVLQHDLKCCGVRSPHDWDAIFSPSDALLPQSCCPSLPLEDKCSEPLASQAGCLDALHASLESNIQVVLIAAGSVALLELIGCLFACCLASSIRQEYETV